MTPKMFLSFVLLILLHTGIVQSDNHEPLNIGGSAEAIFDASITDTEIMMSLFFSQLLKDTGESFNIKVYDDNEQLHEAIRDEKVTAFFADAVQFVALKNELNPQNSYMTMTGDSLRPVYQIIVNKDNNLVTLAQLKDKTIAIPYGHAVGKLFMDVELLKKGLPVSSSFFKSIVNTNQSNSAIIDLYFNKVDAAVVTDFSLENAFELNPQLKNKLTVIKSSQPLAHMIFSFARNFPKDKITFLEPYILNLQNMPRVEKILSRFHFKGLKKIDANTLIEVERLLDQYNQLSPNKPS